MRFLINKLQVQALTDPLTGLLNRTALFDELKYKLMRQKSDPDYQFAVLFLDFDRFKVINDSLGHSAGNELLVRVTRSMVDMLDEVLGHKGYTAARMGGDEFVVEGVQSGLQSKYYRTGRFSPTREKGVHHFHSLLASYLNN